MAETVEVPEVIADLLTSKATVLERFEKGGERMVRISVPQVDNLPVTEAVLRRIGRQLRRLWGSPGSGRDDD